MEMMMTNNQIEIVVRRLREIATSHGGLAEAGAYGGRVLPEFELRLHREHAAAYSAAADHLLETARFLAEAGSDA
jgi:hypothetical protein